MRQTSASHGRASPRSMLASRVDVPRVRLVPRRASDARRRVVRANAVRIRFSRIQKDSAASADAFALNAVESAREAIAEPGCVRFDVLRSMDDRTRFAVVEVWADETSGTRGARAERWEKRARDGSTRVDAESMLAVEPSDEFWSVANGTQWSPSDGSDVGGESVVHVRCDVKPGREAAFAAACAKNASNSVEEAGNLRFDAFQSATDGTKFVLSEVYETASASAEHKNTAHYQAWRDEVADYMATPRTAEKYAIIFPPTRAAWKHQASCEDACETAW